MSGEEEKPIRVVDRRMFTAEGELRPDFEPEDSGQGPARPDPAPRPRAAEEAPPVAAGPRPEGEAEPSAAEPASEFALIVRSLATTAYSALGLLSEPGTGTGRRDPAVARQMIDWLAVLESKTRGNLSFEESDLLTRVLYELRLAYVEVTRAPK